MKTHELKTDPAVFKAVSDGLKTYELRKNDRGFAVHDRLLLRETTHSGADIASGVPLQYTGRVHACTVTHVLAGPVFGLAEGWVILSITRW